MKKILFSAITIALLFLSNVVFSQTPNGVANLGILTSFGAYTGAGGVAGGAGTFLTGDVGTNIGIISGFDAPPAFKGNTYNANATTAQARFDLFRFYIHLNSKFVDYPATHAPAFGGGEILTPGVYSIPAAGSIGGALTLDGGGNKDAFFIIKWGGALTAGAGATITLTGGTQSCNVFFMADGAISIAAAANLKGTLFAKIGAVGIGAGAILEGRMLSMEGAITTGVGAVVSLPLGTCTIPIFCEADCTPATSVNVLGVLSNYALFTSFGAVTNTGTSGINGKIGTDGGASSGYESSIIGGSFATADAATAQAKIDIDKAYTALMALPNTVTDHAAAFGIGEIINAGVYFVNGAGSLGGTLTLDAKGNKDAIFVFKFAGALGIAAQAKIILANGAQRCNIFWIGGAGVATGAVSIGAAADLKGTFLSHGGACTSGAGLFLSGRLLSTAGAATTYAGIIYNSPECVTSTSLGTPVIEAVTETTAGVNGITGGNTSNLTSNDKLNGIAVVIGTAKGNVTLTGVTVPSGLTLNANGTVTVAPGTPAGNYSLTYKICEVTNPTNCSSVTSIIVVTAIVAVGSPDLTISIGQPVPVPIVSQTSFIPVTVTNIGTSPTVGLVTVVVQIPTGTKFGLFPETTTNNGWSCSASGTTTATCTSSTPIVNGTNVIFNVPFIPLPIQVGISLIILPAVVSGGGEVNTTNNISNTIISEMVKSADLTVNFTFLNTVFTVAASRVVVINIKEIGSISTNGTAVEVFIPYSMGFKYVFDKILTSVTVLNNETVNNPNWTSTAQDTGLLLSSNTIIPSNGNSRIAITVTADTAGTVANIIATITPNGGGETNKFNNSATLAQSVQK
jgi:hypothetical protein